MKTLLSLLLLLSFYIVPAQTQMPGMPAVNGTVETIVRSGNTIFIGGSFSTVGGQPRNNLAAFDATTGAITTLSATFSHSVQSLTVAGDKLIVGGGFYLVNGVTHWGVCMFDIATGNLNGWNGNGVYDGYGVGKSGNTIYHVGDAGSSYGKLVATDILTLNLTGWETDSTFYGTIKAVTVIGNYVYMGGDFGFGPFISVYDDLCRFDLATGDLDTAWHPDPVASNFGVTQIIEHKGYIYVGGSFNTISGVSRQGICSFDAAGVLTSFNPNNSASEIFALVRAGDNLFIGGNSYLLGGQTRWRIAEINPANGQATCWNVSSVSSSWSYCNSILACNDTVYTGNGNAFFVFSGSPRPFITGGITGPVQVASSAIAQYSVPLVNGHSYTWNVTGGTATPNSNTVSVNWGAGPTGLVSVIENNSSGGSNCKSDTVWLPVVIGTSDVSDYTNNHLIVYPSPATDELYIENNFNGSCEINIVNNLGERVFNQQVSDKSIRIDISQFNQGIYFIIARHNDETVVRRIVKI